MPKINIGGLSLKLSAILAGWFMLVISWHATKYGYAELGIALYISMCILMAAEVIAHKRRKLKG